MENFKIIANVKSARRPSGFVARFTVTEKDEIEARAKARFMLAAAGYTVTSCASVPAECQ